MELKRDNISCGRTIAQLLIVPYGIETLFTPEPVLNINLLIVPYGIETKVQNTL